MAIKGLPMGLGGQLTPQEQEIRLDQITADPNLQHRARERTDLIAEYAEAMKRGEQFPAIRVVKDKQGTLWLYRGFTRRQAALNIGQKTFPTIVEPGTYRDAWLKSLGENHDHGGRRTRDDLHRAIDAALSDDEIKYALIEEDKEKWSFRKVAKYARTNHHTVSNRWKEIYYPQIVKQVDEELKDFLVRHTYSEVQKTLYKDVAKKLSLPDWFVRERLEEAHRQEPSCQNDPNNSDVPHTGNFPTRQTTSAFDSENDPNDSDVPHTGNFPTRQTTSAFDTENDPNDSTGPSSLLPTPKPNQKPKQSFPSGFQKTTRAKALMDLIIMTNAAGGNVWQFDNAKYVKIILIDEEGEQKEYELPRPHEGILVSMFPRVKEE